MKRETPKQVDEVTAEEVPVLMLPGIGPVAARHGTIASAHFQDLTISFMHSERRTFVLKAAPDRETLSYLKIYDSSQRVAHWPDIMAPAEFEALPVPFETILADFETNLGWIKTSQQGSFRLGIGRIKGDIASASEAAELFRREQQMAAACVMEADKWSQGGKSADITSFHRACLKYLGEERDWGKEIQIRHTKIGSLSGAKIPLEALADGPHDLIEFYSRHPELDPGTLGDPFLAEMFRKTPSLRKKPASA